MSIRPRGIALVASLELRQRVRSVRWYVALAVWFVFLCAMALMIFLAMSQIVGGVDGDYVPVAGRVVFSLGVLLLVFATLLVSPALASAAINGDRSAGTLATMQVTLLSPLEIVLGKVLAGWITGLAFLVAALPSIAPSAIIGGISPWYLLRVILAVALLTLFVTAIGVGLSALTNRTLGSVVLSYLVVLGTSAILPIVFVCTLPLLAMETRVTAYEDIPSADYSSSQCVSHEKTTTVLRTDLTMPLLYVNPFVIVADMAPQIALEDTAEADVDALSAISAGMRYLAHPTDPSHFVDCYDHDAPGYPTDLVSPQRRPVWPWGMGAYLVAAAGSIAFATWRLRTPVRHLGRGTRIA